MATEIAELLAEVMAPAVVPPLLPATGPRPDARLIGEILLEMGAVSPEGLAEALSAQHLENERVGETLVRLKQATDWDVTQALAKQFGLPCQDSAVTDQIDDALVERLPIGYARRKSVIK